MHNDKDVATTTKQEANQKVFGDKTFGNVAVFIDGQGRSELGEKLS